MASLVKSLSFAILVMALIYISMSLMPDMSEMGWKLNAPPPLVNSPSDCQKLGGSLAYGCLKSYALEKKDDSLCAKIDNNFYRDDCYSDFYKGQTSGAICEKMSGAETRGGCFAKIAQVSGNPQACRSAAPNGTSGGDAVDKCFFQYAVSTGDRKTCDSINDAEKASGCLYYFASVTRNPEDCSSILKESADRCLVLLAVDMKDKNACLRLNGDIRDDCMFQIATITKDPSLCRMVANADLASTCLGQIG